jgi:L-serine deaminase
MLFHSLQIKGRRFSHCTPNKKISEIVYENEKSMRTPEVIDHELMRIWNTMLECMYIGAIQKESCRGLERAS